MKFITQTRFGETGNCVQACIASILNKELDEVPDFISIYLHSEHMDVSVFWDSVEEYLLEQGYLFTLAPNEQVLQTGIYLASGTSHRGLPHMVIMDGRFLFHDPHPDQTGVVQIDHIYRVVRKDKPENYISITVPPLT